MLCNCCGAEFGPPLILEVDGYKKAYCPQCKSMDIGIKDMPGLPGLDYKIEVKITKSDE